MSIIDKRNYAHNGAAGNRKRFLDRCKDGLKKAIDDIIDTRDIKDIGKKQRVDSRDDTLEEPGFYNDPNTGSPNLPRHGNDSWKTNDKYRSHSSRGLGSSKRGGDYLGEFEFGLTKKEFLDLLFEGLALPDFIKEQLGKNTKYRFKKAGTSPTGPITKLNVMETLIQAIGRRRATKASLEKRDPPTDPPFLIDEDLRYNLYVKEEVPVKRAVMFCLMDVSGSMGEHERMLAKRFMLLLYLFLEKAYEEVVIRFIIYHVEALEVPEHLFFEAEADGGTMTLSALELMNSIIDKEYDIMRENIYVALASDGGDFSLGYKPKEEELISYLTKVILPKVQYFAYLEVENADEGADEFKRIFGDMPSLKTLLDPIKDQYPKLQSTNVKNLEDVYPLFRELFKGASNG